VLAGGGVAGHDALGGRDVEVAAHEREDAHVDERDAPGDGTGRQARTQRAPRAGIRSGRDGHRGEDMRKTRSVRIALVANSRSGSADRVDEVERLLHGAGGEVRRLPLERFCDGPESVDERRLAHEAARLAEDTDRIVVSGGDGSIGPAALLAMRAGLPLAVLPTGTANSFARFYDLPLEVDEAVRLASPTTSASSAPRSPPRPAAVRQRRGGGPVGPRRPARTGLQAAARRPGLRGRRRAGGGDRPPIRCAVVCDGQEAWSGACWQVLVAATGAFGGDSSTGGVDATDRELDVAIVEAGPRIALVKRAFAMRRGELVDDDAVTHVRGRVVELNLPYGTKFNVDGELLTPTPQRFSVEGTIEVVAP
jgi:diacylglycerol kinase family enzyme